MAPTSKAGHRRVHTSRPFKKASVRVYAVFCFYDSLLAGPTVRPCGPTAPKKVPILPYQDSTGYFFLPVQLLLVRAYNGIDNKLCSRFGGRRTFYLDELYLSNPRLALSKCFVSSIDSNDTHPPPAVCTVQKVHGT